MLLLIGLAPNVEFEKLKFQETIPVFLETTDVAIGVCSVNYDQISIIGELQLTKRVKVEWYMNYLLNPINKEDISLVGLIISANKLGADTFTIERTLLQK